MVALDSLSEPAEFVLPFLGNGPEFCHQKIRKNVKHHNKNVEQSYGVHFSFDVIFRKLEILKRENLAVGFSCEFYTMNKTTYVSMCRKTTQ